MVAYPLSEFESENKLEENQCLQETEKILDEWPIPIAAIIIEPIQGEGGDNHASPHYFQRLREITKQRGILMIVDEVQTGVGATGTFWAHEQWNLETPPDFVTFSKKMQVAGFYHSIETRPDAPYRNFNTWMGDPIRVYQAESIIQEIENYNLLELVKETGLHILSGLEDIQSRFPLIERVRGKGTYIAFDVLNGKRDGLLSALKSRGLNMGGSGSNSVRLRPMLILTPAHADIFLTRLEDALGSM